MTKILFGSRTNGSARIPLCGVRVLNKKLSDASVLQRSFNSRFSIFIPIGLPKHGLVLSPELNTVVMNARHDTHAFGLTVEGRLLEKAPHEMRSIIGPHIQPDQTVARMTKFPGKEIPVHRKERRSAPPVQ